LRTYRTPLSVALAGCILGAALLALGCAGQPGGGGEEGRGVVEGWVYLTPASTAAVTTGTTFRVSSVAQPSLGSVPPGTTTVSLSGGGGYETTLDSGGHYRIAGVAPGVYGLAILEQSGQQTRSETFPGLVVAPETTTAGLTAPVGYAVRIVPPTSATLVAGHQLTLTARLVTSPGGTAVTSFAGPFDWESEQPSVASVSQGVVSGLTAGTAWIRASVGPLSDRLQVTVQGSAAQAVVLTSAALVQSVAGKTRIAQFSVAVDGGTVTLPAGSLALVTPPSGTPVTTLTPTASGGALSLPSAVDVAGTGVMVVSFRAPSGEEIVFAAGTGGEAHVEQLQFRCTVTQVGTVLFPADLALALPTVGSPASQAYADFGGVPAGGHGALTLEPGGTLEDSPDGTGAVHIAGFPSSVTVGVLGAVRLEVLGP
jgi:hypothetical protein